MPNNLYSTMQSGYIYEIFFNRPFTFTGGGSSPTGIWLGLTGPVPTNQSITELSVSNYARQPIGTGFPTWNYTYGNASGLVYNNNQITFPVAAANWGWVSGAFLADGGYPGSNVLFYVNLSVAMEITQNSQFYIPQSGCYVRLS